MVALLDRTDHLFLTNHALSVIVR